MRNAAGPTSLSRTLSLMQRRRWPYVGSIVFSSLTVAGMAVLNSVMYKRVIGAVTEGLVNPLQQTLLLMLASVVLVCIVTPISAFLCTRLAKETMANARQSLFAHLVRLPKLYFDRHHSGELLSRLTNDLGKVEAIYGGQFYVPVEAFAIGSLSMVMVLVLNWRLALISLIAGALSATANLAFAGTIKQVAGRLQKCLSHSSQRFIDLITGNREIKLFGIHQQISARLTYANRQVEQERIELAGLSSSLDAMNFILSDLAFFGVLGAGAWMVTRGFTEWGTVVAVLMLKGGTDDLFLKLGSSYATLQASLAGADRFFELMDEPEEEMDRVEACREKNDRTSEVEPLEHAMVITDLSFSYDGQTNVLDRLNLVVEKGETLAIVGPSGSGKSTLAKLLTGLYRPHAGRMLIDGEIAYVPQDGVLFQGSVIENIRFGRPGATDGEVLLAAEAAHVDAFVKDLPDGYETLVGENGSRLSGGEKQRVAIARALLRDAPILFLDEATSALDAGSAIIVQRALDRLMRGRTTIIITHHPERLPRIDRMLRLEQGSLITMAKSASLQT